MATRIGSNAWTIFREGLALGLTLTITLIVSSPTLIADPVPPDQAKQAADVAERDRVWKEAQQLRQQGKLAEAVKAAQQVAAIEEKLRGPDNKDLISTWGFVAGCAQELEDWPAAEAARDSALRIAKLVYGESDWRTADAGRARQHLAQLQKLNAEDRRALHQAEETSAKVEQLRRQGKFADAVILAKQVVDVRERLLGPEHPETARSLHELAFLYKSQGNYAAAEPLYQRALKIRAKVLGPEHPETARSLHELAFLYKSQGNYAAAEPLYQRALKIRAKVLGPEHPETARSLHELAFLYKSQGNYAAAEPLYQRALAIQEKALGPEHPDTARSLNNLAELYRVQGNYAAAEPLYQRALKILEKVLGPEHADTATSLNNLAFLYKSQGNYAAAEPLYQRALAIYEKALGAEHPDTAMSLNNLAVLYQTQGNYAAAEPLYQRALNINEKALGPEHPTTAGSLNNLGFLHWCTGESRSARSLTARGLDIQLRHLEQTAAIQTEQEQFLMAGSVSGHLNVLLTVTSDDPGAAGEAWRRVVAWKGLTTTRQAGLRQALKNDPTYGEFRRVSQQLSTASLNPPLPPSDPKTLAAWNERGPELRRQWQEEKTRLETEYQRLEKELARKSAAVRQAHERRAVTPDDVQSGLGKLPHPTALVDLLEYWYVGRQNKNEVSQWRIAAFVIRPEGKIERIELGPAEPIHAELTAWRQTYGRSKDQHDPGGELRRLLWEPLESHLEGIETVLISPDGILAQLPWGALPGGKPGTFLIEERSIAVIPVPQIVPELLHEDSHVGPPVSLLLAGDIDYGGDAGTPGDLLAKREAIGRQRDGRWMEFPKLSAAQGELTSVRDWYEQAEGSGNVDVLRRRQGTEGAFRDQAPQHSWLHVITHGFFAPPELSARLSESAFQEPPVKSPETAPAVPAQAGIGAALEVKDAHCIVTQVVAAGAAAKDGHLKVGDEIVAIAPAEGDWSELAGKELSAIVALIRGPLASTVRIKIRPREKPDQEVELALTRAALPTPPQGKPAPIHPGLLSGLAFAGANVPPEAGKDDGILTALEVSALDLSRVDTVVLSACETGLGQVAGGEGLLGLQRAFQVAGAKTVVASLWKVPDAATSRLMQRFYENLWDKKMGKLEALRDAQIWMMRDKGNRGLAIANGEPADSDTLPPFYWAAFVLSGDWR